MRPRAALTLARLVALSAGLAALSGCGGPAIRRFPLKAPMTRDTDLDPVRVACRPDPDAKPDKNGVKAAACLPEAYESPFAWDGANQMVFRPISRFFAVRPGGEAINVNALDEVPDSAWFTNRIGRRPMTPEEVARGYCDDKVLDPSAADGTWLIDQGKPNGANPGFRLKVDGVGKFMMKADPPDQPERASGATAIAARLYYAMGWWAPCDSVVYFRKSILKLSPGLKVTDNSGITRDFDEAALTKVLAGASKRGELTRMTASKWLPGRTIGPFTYDGRREDDPADVIDHEDRRDLRGARVIAAWLNHFDSREQNSMDTWMPVNEKEATSSPGHVRHWYIDLGDCFGSEWEWDPLSRRLGHAYYLDFNYMAEDFVTLGILERPWDRASRRPPFGYFTAKGFDPEAWRGGYPNPAFGRMTEHDAAWAARIMARLRDEHVAAAVKVADYSNPDDEAFLIRSLIERRDAVLKRYLARLSPVGELSMRGKSTLCGTDLSRHSGVFGEDRFRYEARVYGGDTLADRGAAKVSARPDGELCVELTHLGVPPQVKDDSPNRYVVVDVDNGQARYPLRAHLYDLGEGKGFVLVGAERPESKRPPRAD